MSLYEQWTALVESQDTQELAEAFWKDYFAMEKVNYAQILTDTSKVHEGTLKELAEGFSMEPMVFVGFLDGINTSLDESIELENLTEDSSVKLSIDYERLYFNMLEAKADWLYNLSEWEDVLPEEERKRITKEYRVSNIAVSTKVGRNEACPCGSGKKYKKCCGA